MLKDLEAIHDVLLEAYKAIMLLSGTDLDALVKEFAKARENGEGVAVDESPICHLPI